jgi:hypothetical protein
VRGFLVKGFLFVPLTKAAEEWIQEHVVDASYHGPKLITEPRALNYLIEAMRQEIEL